MCSLDRPALLAAGMLALLLVAAAPGSAYPPGVGILGKSRSCMVCHTNDGPWGDEARTIIDVLDAGTRKSLRGPEGVFRIEVPRGENRTVLTVIGRKKGDAKPPLRNAWLYVDPAQIQTAALSKFAPGWDVNLPMACRIIGDASDLHPDALVTVLPMTVRPSDAAQDAEIELQVMLTAGESVKGRGKEGLVSNYFVRRVALDVVDAPRE